MKGETQWRWAVRIVFIGLFIAVWVLIGRVETLEKQVTELKTLIQTEAGE